MLAEFAKQRISIAHGYKTTLQKLNHNICKALVLTLTLVASDLTASNLSKAHLTSSGISRELLLKKPLPDFPDHMLTALTVELAPGKTVGAHRHGGLVYVYLLEGRVRSQLKDEEIKDYVAGQSWIEPAGILHRKTENPSKTETAKFLAIIYSKKDATITKAEGN